MGYCCSTVGGYGVENTRGVRGFICLTTGGGDVVMFVWLAGGVICGRESCGLDCHLRLA